MPADTPLIQGQDGASWHPVWRASRSARSPPSNPPRRGSSSPGATGTNAPWRASFFAQRVTPAVDWRGRRLAPEVWLLGERDLGTTPSERQDEHSHFNLFNANTVLAKLRFRAVRDRYTEYSTINAELATLGSREILAGLPMRVTGHPALHPTARDLCAAAHVDRSVSPRASLSRTDAVGWSKVYPRGSWSVSGSTRRNSGKSPSVVKMDRSRRDATAHIRKSVLDP